MTCNHGEATYGTHRETPVSDVTGYTYSCPCGISGYGSTAERAKTGFHLEAERLEIERIQKIPQAERTYGERNKVAYSEFGSKAGCASSVRVDFGG